MPNEVDREIVVAMGNAELVKFARTSGQIYNISLAFLMAQLNHLSNEILRLITERVPSSDALSLMPTSRRIYGLSTPRLYCNLCICDKTLQDRNDCQHPQPYSHVHYPAKLVETLMTNRDLRFLVSSINVKWIQMYITTDDATSGLLYLAGVRLQQLRLRRSCKSLLLRRLPVIESLRLDLAMIDGDVGHDEHTRPFRMDD